VILAVDPGSKKSGYATFTEEGALQQYGVCNGNPVTGLEEIHKIVKAAAPQFLFIESQFFAPGRKSFGLLTLIESRCVWEVLCRLQGAEVKTVDPAVWQAYFRLRTDMTVSSKTERQKEFKQRIATMASCIIGKKVQENEADAILIGYYSVFNLGKGSHWLRTSP